MFRSFVFFLTREHSMLFESIKHLHKQIHRSLLHRDAQLSLLTNSKSDDKLDLAANLFIFFFAGLIQKKDMERVKVRPILMAQQVCHKLFVDGAELIETKRDTTNHAAIIWYADGKDDPPRFVVKEFEQMCEEFNMEVKVCRKIQSLKRKKITLNFVKARPLPPLRIMNFGASNDKVLEALL